MNSRNTDPFYLFRVVAGDHNRYESEGTEQGRLVVQIVKHANYSDETTNNDIALLKLDRPITYDRYVQVIFEILKYSVDKRDNHVCLK